MKRTGKMKLRMSKMISGLIALSVISIAPLSHMVNVPVSGMVEAFAKEGDLSMIGNPRTADGVSTWDCVWFGDYWQEDTNGDGYCLNKSRIIEKKSYPADDKQPIKWRVLSIDDDKEALLLSDRLLDVKQYSDSVSGDWAASSLRSYLSGAFLSNAFSREEQSLISTVTLNNPDDSVTGAPGGGNTVDRVFCLSVEEAMDPDYGFVSNEFTKEINGLFLGLTENDITRTAEGTAFLNDAEYWSGGTYKPLEKGADGLWWLRGPVYDSCAPGVSIPGAVYDCYFYNVTSINVYIRPAVYVKLQEDEDLWSYAGTVASDGIVDEKPYEKEAEPVTYTVSFDSKGGSEVSPQTVSEGEKATEPDPPRRTGFTFNHWYQADEKIPFDFNIPVLSNIMLTASWSSSDKEEDEDKDKDKDKDEDKDQDKDQDKDKDKDKDKETDEGGSSEEGDEGKDTDKGGSDGKHEGDEGDSGRDSTDKPDDSGVSDNSAVPAEIPSDWTKLKHVTPENAISSNYCVIASKQKFDVKTYIKGAGVYKSSSSSIASVGRKSGIVRGKKAGDAVITGYIRSGGQLIPTGSYTVHIVTPELNRKQYLKFNIDGSIDGNELISNEVLSPTMWKSSKPSVATVSSNSGRISVLKPKGTAKITAYYGQGKNAARYRFALRIRPSSGDR